MSLFEISKDQLRQLNDSQLRELVARLCEAELQLKGFPASAVRWGGAQTTPDGGLDVDCRIEADSFEGDFVPCARTGLQVKKHSMPAGAIADEMSPKGELRSIFADLASENGCYVIVSLEDDVPPGGAMLSTRLSAMDSQVGQIQHSGSLKPRFYGRGELANWLREHPGVQIWVRRLLGLPRRGWRPYGRWAMTPSSVEDDLICKEGVVIRTPRTAGEGLGISQAITEIRDLVRSSDKAVRVVGLSGVGKTRIVQALFEEEVGSDALPSSLALYADVGESPEPSTREMIEMLVAERRHAIVVLDNCAGETHEALTKLVKDEPNIELVSIEYDIQEDRPESTSVVRIHAEGPGIAEALVLRRYPNLGQANARRIGDFSGGNARLALVLAEAVREEASLSHFTNAHLFTRLFYQRRSLDKHFLAEAEALALVYSYSVERDENGADELGALAQIVGHSRQDMYRATQLLMDRGLAQKRGRWRAVLPHAVANELAANGLNRIDPEEILGTLQTAPTIRLLKSFARRLGYLHEHEIAQAIVGSWLSPDGLLSRMGDLSDTGMQVLRHIAPVAPQAVLSGIENLAREKSSEELHVVIDDHGSKFTEILILIAYDHTLFDRCVAVLAQLALGNDRRGPLIEERLSRLFSPYLSGTEVDPETRERTMRIYLLDTDLDQQRLGIGMLESALRGRRWQPIVYSEFGARPRTYGYHPRTLEERDGWYLRYLALAEEVALTGRRDLSEAVRAILARNLDGLWNYRGLRSTLASVLETLHKQRTWIEGWRAVRRIKSFWQNDPEETSEKSAVLEELDRLDKALMPVDLVDQVRTYVLGLGASQSTVDGFEDLDLEHALRRGAERANALGMAAAGHPEVMEELWGEFFTAHALFGRQFSMGMAEHTQDLQPLLARARKALEQAGDQATNCGLVAGIVAVMHERDPNAARRFLDEAAENDALRRFVISLNASVPLTASSVARLHRLLEYADTPTGEFIPVGFKQEFADLPEGDLAKLMRKLIEREDGPQAVLESMSMRLGMQQQENLSFGGELRKASLTASAQLLRQPDYLFPDSMTSHYLANIMRYSLEEEQESKQTDGLMDALLARLKAFRGEISPIEDAVAAIAEKATIPFLDRVLNDNELDDQELQEVFAESQERNPLTDVQTSRLLAWCKQGDFESRLVLLARFTYPFEKESSGREMELTAQAISIVEAAPDPSQVVAALSFAFQPRSWTGSFAQAIGNRRRALKILLSHSRPDIRAAAKQLNTRIGKLEREYRQSEGSEDDLREQGFE